MSFRHGLAIALVGWFLMAPPFDHATKKIELAAPLSKWQNLHAINSRWEGQFESREKCEQFRANFLQWWDHREPDFQNQPFHRILYDQMRLARCITPDSLARAPIADDSGDA